MSVPPSRLAWAQVDPSRIPFDPSVAERAARSVQAPAGPPTRERRRAIQTALDEAFRASCGDWAGGWLWGRGEAEIDGGPGAVWCCESHCVLRPGEVLEDTVLRALEALRGWREHLERLAALFRSLPSPTAPEHLEEAALELVAFAVDETGCESAWYGYVATILAWYVESLGAPRRGAELAGQAALTGRFESWTAPTEAHLHEAAEDFGSVAFRALR